MKKINYLVIFLFVLTGWLNGQTGGNPYVIGSMAGSGTNGTYTIYQSVGEPIIETGFDGNALYFTQGFLQPEYIGTSGELRGWLEFDSTSCAGVNDGVVRVKYEGGHGNVGIMWQLINHTEKIDVFRDLPPGEYMVKLFDTLPNNTVIPYKNNPLKITIPENNKPCPVHIYNAFSPNHDGKNEVFYIHNIENYPDNEVYIFNRWGTLLWSVKKYDNNEKAWRGIDSKGDPVVEGTYYYVLILNNNNNKPLKGWVEVTR